VQASSIDARSGASAKLHPAIVLPRFQTIENAAIIAAEGDVRWSLSVPWPGFAFRIGPPFDRASPRDYRCPLVRGTGKDLASQPLQSEVPCTS